MILVFADDISGASELAGAAMHHGLSAEVQTVLDTASTADVICLDTDTRSCEPARAAQVAGAAASVAVAARPEWIYKKCDSVLRGNVVAEARAIAGAAGVSRIVLLSANPSRNRVIRDGRYFVDGVPLEETPFATDPRHPRTSSSIATLLGGDLTGIHMPDATSPAEVAQVAHDLGPDTLAVGALDFFDALLDCRRPARTATQPTTFAAQTAVNTHAGAGTTLLVCGSAASWSARRAAAAASGIAVHAMPHDISAAVHTLQTHRQALVGIGDGTVVRGLSPEELVEALAGTVAAIVRAVQVDRLLLEGGATAAAVVRALGWNRLSACTTAPAGVGCFVPTGQTRPLLVIKPGSYLWPREIWPR